MNVRPWLAAGACAAAAALIPVSGAAAGTTAVQRTTARAAAPPSVRVKGLHALAHVPAPHTVLPRVVHRKSAAQGGITTLYTPNWSGYAVQAAPNVQLRFVAANFNVPKINCAKSTPGSSGDADASQWVGLDGLTDTTVEQTGINGYCPPGSKTPWYYAWYEMYPAPNRGFSGIHAGDAINVSVYYNQGTDQYNLVLNDLTTGGSINVNRSCPANNTCQNSSAEVISEAPGGGPPSVNLADYAMENFTTADVTSLDGYRGSLSPSRLWSTEAIYMINTAQPSSLQGGEAFSTQWLASS